MRPGKLEAIAMKKILSVLGPPPNKETSEQKITIYSRSHRPDKKRPFLAESGQIHYQIYYVRGSR